MRTKQRPPVLSANERAQIIKTLKERAFAGDAVAAHVLLYGGHADHNNLASTRRRSEQRNHMAAEANNRPQ